MKPSEVKLCCLIGHIITMGVVSLYISLSSGGHPNFIQECVIQINQVVATSGLLRVVLPVTVKGQLRNIILSMIGY